VSNVLHSESPLQKCPQCNGQCKNPLPILTVHRDIGDAGWKQASPLIERKQTRVEIDASHFVETVETPVHKMCYSNGLCFMPVTKVPCGPREAAISRDRWLVVLTVIVWCSLQILVVLRRTWNNASHFVKIVETQVHIRRFWYWAFVTGFALVPVVKGPCGPRETTISRERWLVVITVVV
jgi:hypothetical protein